MTMSTTAVTAETIKTTGTEPMDLNQAGGLKTFLSILASCFRALFRRRRTHAETCNRRFGQECDC